jgi:hypothetical protein
MHLQLNVTTVFPAPFREDEHFLKKKHITGAGMRYYLYAVLTDILPSPAATGLCDFY